MQHEQQWKLLKTLGAADCSAVVLVGNNLSAPEMKQQIIEAGGKNVLFGFQGTGGNRYEDYTEVLSLHAPSMVLGGLGENIPGEITSIVESTFAGADYEIKWMDDMDAWYKCHAAFIVPVARLCYTVGCDLRKSTGKQRKMLFDATSNAFEALKKSGCAVRPEGEDAYYRPGRKARPDERHDEYHVPHETRGYGGFRPLPACGFRDGRACGEDGRNSIQFRRGMLRLQVDGGFRPVLGGAPQDIRQIKQAPTDLVGAF